MATKNDEISEIKKYLQSLTQLSNQEKQKYIDMMDKGEDFVDILDMISDGLQQKLDKVYQDAGIEIDYNDPEVKQADAEMNAELRAAAEEFNQEMGKIKKLAQDLHTETVREADESQMTALRNKLNQDA
ncbi:MAG: hypothetical protein PHP25_04090 [Candidatus Moranbacteria bacterium]|nr:hypothetical protein [Candidatus Moranbacteria bacterium]